MNISFNKRDAVSGVLKIEVTKEDYAEKVETGLREARRKANIPGFRKGMVPMGMISKIYRKSLLAEAINELSASAINEYIRGNELNMIGEPIYSEAGQKELDLNSQETFELCFDLALAPDVRVELSKNDHIPYYKVTIGDDLLEKRLEYYRATLGTYDTEAEEVGENDVVKGRATELPGDEAAGEADKIVVEAAMLTPSYLKDEETKQRFIGAKKGTTLTFNPLKSFGENEAEIASFLKIEKDTARNITGDFSFEIEEITHYKEAELNQELFDKVFGDSPVTDEETFRERLRESIGGQYAPQSDYKFLLDARRMLLDKTSDMVFADDVLKRWLVKRGEYKTKEQAEENYPLFAVNLKYHLIKEHIIKANNLTVENEEVEAIVRRMVRAQLAQYGATTLSEEIVDAYAAGMLKDENVLRNAVERLMDEKLTDWLKTTLTLDIKEVTAEELATICEEQTA